VKACALPCSILQTDPVDRLLQGGDLAGMLYGSSAPLTWHAGGRELAMQTCLGLSQLHACGVRSRC
jgi:hypothetical protein